MIRAVSSSVMLWSLMTNGAGAGRYRHALLLGARLQVELALRENSLGALGGGLDVGDCAACRGVAAEASIQTNLLWRPGTMREGNLNDLVGAGAVAHLAVGGGGGAGRFGGGEGGAESVDDK